MRTITLLRLVMSGFRSFYEETALPFRRPAGLVMVGGDNRVEPRLGANGCGKSSIWDAICVCFYGTSVRGIRIGDLVSHGREMLDVAVTIDIDGTEHVIERTGPPMRVFIDGVRVEQLDVDQLLGLNRLQFLNSVLFGQAMPLFIDKSIPERGELLDEVMDLHLWNRASDVAGRKSVEAAAAASRLQVEIGRTEGALNALEPLDIIQKRIDSWAEQQRQHIEQLLGQLDAKATERDAVDDGPERAWEEQRWLAVEALIGRVEAKGIQAAEVDTEPEKRWQREHDEYVRGLVLQIESRVHLDEADDPESEAWEEQRFLRVKELWDKGAGRQAELEALASTPAAEMPDIATPKRDEARAQATLLALSGELAVVRRAQESVSGDIDFFRDTDDCPVCKQPITPEFSAQHQAELCARAESLAKQREALEGQIDVANLSIRTAQEAVAAARALVTKIEREEAIRHLEIISLTRDVESLREQMVRAQREQNPHVAAREARAAAVEREIDSLRMQVTREQAAKNPHTAARLTLLAAIEREITDLEAQIERESEAVNPHVELRREKIASLDREMAELEKQIQREADAINPHEETRTRVKAETAALRDRLIQQTKQAQTIIGQQAVLDFWRQTFRQVRLFCIRRVLDQLDVETMNAAQSLGLVGWKISHATETETKSGSQKLGVQVEVESPTMTGPFVAWSGGEGQRVRLATALGFGRLLQRWSGVRWRLEVFDEPTAFLSETGIEDLLDLLRDRADDQDKAIFISDHRGLIHSGFSSMIMVLKDKNGSRIEHRGN